MIRHGLAPPDLRTAALRVPIPHTPFPKIAVTDASSGRLHFAGNCKTDRQDAPSASSRTFSVTDQGTPQTNLTTKSPQATT